jgi:hypothetical protein
MMKFMWAKGKNIQDTENVLHTSIKTRNILIGVSRRFTKNTAGD